MILTNFWGCSDRSNTEQLPDTEQLLAVKMDANGFLVGDKRFRFIGANSVNLIFYDDFGLSIEKAFRTAKENNINVHRIYLDWGYWTPEDYDKILDVATREKVYILLTLTDCVPSTGSTFCNFASEYSINAFKSRIKQLILRRNSINGKIYRDDTTIFGWDIANEPELWRFNYSEIQHWISEIAGYVKELDTNHLVTIGIANSSEYDQSGSIYDVLNIPEVDFFSFHFYVVPPDWDESILPNDYQNRISSRTINFLSMNKPVVMEEFGFSASGELNLKIRKAKETVGLYCEVYEKSMDAAFFSGASGMMFWGWGVPEDKNVPLWWAPEDHDTTDVEFCALIKNYAARLNNN
jgi:endo-1,4-beta-mannosidase